MDTGNINKRIRSISIYLRAKPLLRLHQQVVIRDVRVVIRTRLIGNRHLRARLRVAAKNTARHRVLRRLNGVVRLVRLAHAERRVEVVGILRARNGRLGAHAVEGVGADGLAVVGGESGGAAVDVKAGCLIDGVNGILAGHTELSSIS